MLSDKQKERIEKYKCIMNNAMCLAGKDIPPEKRMTNSEWNKEYDAMVNEALLEWLGGRVSIDEYNLLLSKENGQ